MPEEGAFKRATRDGEWSADEAVWRHLTNEMSLLRASFYTVNGGKKAAYEPFLFKSRAQAKVEEAKVEEVEVARESVFDFADFTKKLEV